MQFETWWLLAVPIIFALGWMAARIDLTELLHQSKQLPRSYFNGLNFLLNDQPDRAIEAFIEVVELDPETIELHFALGSLFRRRGETERAIRVHRNLLERADLPVEFRDEALFSLAQDYLKAGLLDRAEASFKQLTPTPYAPRAWHFLSEIYQIESDWPSAIHAATQVTVAVKDSSEHDVHAQIPRQLAHFWCELAQQAIARADWSASSMAIANARKSDSKLMRIAQVEIALAQARAETAQALQLINAAQKKSPDFAAQLAPLLIALEPNNHATNARRLERWFDAHASTSLVLAALEQWQAAGDRAAASTFARRALEKVPTLAVSAAVLNQKLQLPAADPDLEAISAIVAAAVGRERSYECTHCGFRAKQFYWQCPGCKHWETLPYVY